MKAEVNMGGQIHLEPYARSALAIMRIGDEVRAETRATANAISYTETAYGTMLSGSGLMAAASA